MSRPALSEITPAPAPAAAPAASAPAVLLIPKEDVTLEGLLRAAYPQIFDHDGGFPRASESNNKSWFSTNAYWLMMVALTLLITAYTVLVYFPNNLWGDKTASRDERIKNLVFSVSFNYILNATCGLETLTNLSRQISEYLSQLFQRKEAAAIAKRALAGLGLLKCFIEVAVAYYAASIYSGMIDGFKGHWTTIPPEWTMSLAYIILTWPGVHLVADSMLLPLVRYTFKLLRQMMPWSSDPELDRDLKEKLQREVDASLADDSSGSQNNFKYLDWVLKVFLGLSAVFGVSGLSRYVFNEAIKTGSADAWMKAVAAVIGYLPVALRFSFQLASNIATSAAGVWTRLSKDNDSAAVFLKKLGGVVLESLPALICIGLAYNTTETSVVANKKEIGSSVAWFVLLAINIATIIGTMVFNGQPMAEFIQKVIQGLKSFFKRPAEVPHKDLIVQTFRQVFKKTGSLKLAFRAVGVPEDEINQAVLKIREAKLDDPKISDDFAEKYGPHFSAKLAKDVLNGRVSMINLMGRSSYDAFCGLWGSFFQLLMPVGILCVISQFVFSLQQARNDIDIIFATTVSVFLSQLICRFLVSLFNQCKDLWSIVQLFGQFMKEMLGISVLGGALVYLTSQFAKAALGLEGTPIVAGIVGTLMSAGVAVACARQAPKVLENPPKEKSSQRTVMSHCLSSCLPSLFGPGQQEALNDSLSERSSLLRNA